MEAHAKAFHDSVVLHHEVEQHLKPIIASFLLKSFCQPEASPMLDLVLGDELSVEAPAFFFQVDILGMVQNSGPAETAVLVFLFCFSVYSWTVILAKWQALRGARKANSSFLRMFRKATGIEAVLAASEQYRKSPLVVVFDFGYEEVERQVKARGSLTNRNALERTLQIGISEELAKLERRMNWLATTASVTPFIGLLGTVLGIIRAFLALSEQGSTSLKTVGPGIATGAGGDRGRPVRRDSGGDCV